MSYPREIELSMNVVVEEGSIILLYYDVKRQWLLKVDKGKQFHTHKGVINLDNVLGLQLGSEVKSSLGESFWILKPTTHDFIMHSVRRTQIMYPKDIGIIILKLGLTSGSRILEIGTGSGAMTVAAATAVKPAGHVDTYEARPEFAEMAERNFRRAGVSEYVTIHHGDARFGLEGDDYDAAVIDVGDPWPILPLVHKAISGGSPTVSFSPTVNQVERTTQTMRDIGFANIHTLECFIREIRAETGKTRPATIMIGHTGYMTFAQKIINRAPSETTLLTNSVENGAPNHG
ncbi:MAG TPA: tRNA (adenine-N1)-methyltransferase [Terriglobales bacterium]|nr:tRNA (adenine-N1)-methyltransferase [Terriglobales bacterium]